MYSIFTFVWMPLKDYYQLLQVKPGSDIAAVKKAFRKLAHAYHPDKKGLNKANHDYFTSIQEAYSTLTDPEKREKYHYQRWLEKASGNEFDHALNAPEILKLFLQVEKNISQENYFNIDAFRMGRQLLTLFSTDRLLTISNENDEEMVNTVHTLALSLAAHLNTGDIGLLAAQFEKNLPSWHHYEKKWNALIRKKELKYKVNQLKLPVALLITLILCIICYILLS